MLDRIIICKPLFSEEREFDISLGAQYCLKCIEPSDPLFDFLWESFENDLKCIEENIGLFQAMARRYYENK